MKFTNFALSAVICLSLLVLLLIPSMTAFQKLLVGPFTGNRIPRRQVPLKVCEILVASALGVDFLACVQTLNHPSVIAPVTTTATLCGLAVIHVLVVVAAGANHFRIDKELLSLALNLRSEKSHEVKLAQSEKEKAEDLLRDLHRANAIPQRIQRAESKIRIAGLKIESLRTAPLQSEVFRQAYNRYAIGSLISFPAASWLVAYCVVNQALAIGK